MAECLEEAARYPEWHPVVIYHEEELIGFAMYGSFGVNKDTWIDRKGIKFFRAGFLRFEPRDAVFWIFL